MEYDLVVWLNRLEQKLDRALAILEEDPEADADANEGDSPTKKGLNINERD